MDALFKKVAGFFFTEKCFEEFFINLKFSDVECIKQTISKALGVGIIVGSTLVKLPQIMKLYTAKSSEGLSFMSVLLEVFAMTSAASYSFAQGYPFSSYGETLFLLIETALIGFLVLFYSKQPQNAYIFGVLYSVVGYLFFSGIIPLSVLWSLQIANVPIVIVGKMIQVLKNYHSGHTGQLSSITVFLLFLGSCARIFTSIQETGDTVIVSTFIAASVTNGMLATQILYYWEATNRKMKSHIKDQ